MDSLFKFHRCYKNNELHEFIILQTTDYTENTDSSFFIPSEARFFIWRPAPPFTYWQQAFGEPEDEGSCEESRDGVYEVVCLDIDGGAAEERPKRDEHGQQAGYMAAGKEEYDGADSYVAAGEGGGGSFPGLSRMDEVVEESFGVAGGGQHLGMAAEISTQRRKVACLYRVDANGLEVVLRTCYGKEDVDDVEEEEGEEDEGRNGEE